jgi:GNAT superfamily N-acetyltransferase
VSDKRIIPATTPVQIEVVRTLFLEYADAAGACECFQGFAKEVAELPGQYAPPGGRLLIAEVDSRPAGCVALRKLDEGVCEMKRLYVRPDFRGHKLGRQLAETAIEEARRADYRMMRLDTLPSMVAARVLYESLGFHPTARYNDNPGEGTIYLELKLT